MTKDKKPKVAEPIGNIKLQLVKEELRIKEKGKIIVAKDEQGEIRYIRNDALGLMGILGRLDSRIHSQLRDQQQWIKVRDKIHQCLLHDLDTLELNLDEAKFLKDFLKEFPDKDGKNNPMAEFEVRSRIGVLEQFEVVT